MSNLTISYSRGKYHITWQEGMHHTNWDFLAEEFSPELLREILNVVQPNNTGPLFLQPAPNGYMPVAGPPVNEGAARADRAAREAEMALRNGGKALSQGIALDAPAYEDNQIKGLALPGDFVVPAGLEEAWAAFKAASEGTNDVEAE